MIEQNKSGKDMEILITIGLVLFVLWMAVQLIGCSFATVNEWKKLRNPCRQRRRNFIVINGRKYHPKRTGRETDCKTECPLYACCEKGSHSICMALQHPYEDVIMVEDGRE
jgi:hypothetical protein